MRNIPVRNAMTLDVETAEPSTLMTEVARVMAEKEIGSVVITKDGKAIGIICERDVLNKVVAADVKPSDLNAEDIMEEPLIATEQRDNILDAIRLIVRNNIGHLPVLENEMLVGILTVQDVLKTLPEILETLPRPEEEQEGLSKSTEEGVCELCGEVKNNLVEQNGRWICNDCLDFLTG